MKLDELMEKERLEKDCMSRRAGVLNLMLHSTSNHEVLEKIEKMMKQQQKAGPPPGANPQMKKSTSGSQIVTSA